MITLSDYLYTRVHLYTIIVCTDGMTIDVWPHTLLARYMSPVVCFYINITLYDCLHLSHCSCPIILLLHILLLIILQDLVSV